jgi:hypothetical protein
MKLVGGDSGRYENETFVEEVLLTPSERAIIDVRFERPGRTRSSTARLYNGASWLLSRLV